MVFNAVFNSSGRGNEMERGGGGKVRDVMVKWFVGNKVRVAETTMMIMRRRFVLSSSSAVICTQHVVL